MSVNYTSFLLECYRLTLRTKLYEMSVKEIYRDFLSGKRTNSVNPRFIDIL